MKNVDCAKVWAEVMDEEKIALAIKAGSILVYKYSGGRHPSG